MRASADRFGTADVPLVQTQFTGSYVGDVIV